MEGLQLLPAKNLRQSSVTFQAEGLVGPRQRALLSEECQVAALCENSSCCQFGIPISPGKSPCSLVKCSQNKKEPSDVSGMEKPLLL